VGRPQGCAGSIPPRSRSWRTRLNSFSLAPALFRSGTGTIGQINASSISSGSFTLANPTDAIFFARNQVLMASSTDGGGTTRAGTGYVLSADPATGIVVVSATAAGGSAGNPSGWTASDFLFVQGDQNLKIKGLSAWLPFTRPTTGDSFWNVDRSVAPSIRQRRWMTGHGASGHPTGRLRDRFGGGCSTCG
jgi:hypothetical protein